MRVFIARILRSSIKVATIIQSGFGTTPPAPPPGDPGRVYSISGEPVYSATGEDVYV